MRRLFSVWILLATVAACGPRADDLAEPPVALGDFNLAHNVVVASKAQRLPTSREVTEEALVAALRSAIAERFDRYEGKRLYHFGLSVEGYNLASPGIPILLSPKSAIIIRLTVWDDAENRKLNEDPKQITLVEQISGDAVIGSGFTQTAEEQLASLAASVAKAVENYLVAQNAEHGWFERPPEPASDTSAQQAEETAPAQ